MYDNLQYPINVLRGSVASLKKKVSNLKISVEALDAEIEKIDTRFDKLITETEIYKVKLERELGREVRRLEKELEETRKAIPKVVFEEKTEDPHTLAIASTMAVLECVLMHICENAADVRLASSAFLFPAVIERVVTGYDEAYFIKKLPASAEEVIKRGREYVNWVRSEVSTHITDPQAWDETISLICDWWKNDALPLLYGSRDEQWDIDVPLSLTEMLSWQDNPGDRPIYFSSVFDAYEIYRKHKDEVYESSGVKDFDIKMFTKPN